MRKNPRSPSGGRLIPVKTPVHLRAAGTCHGRSHDFAGYGQQARVNVLGGLHVHLSRRVRWHRLQNRHEHFVE